MSVPRREWDNDDDDVDDIVAETIHDMMCVINAWRREHGPFTAARSLVRSLSSVCHSCAQIFAFKMSVKSAPACLHKIL